MVLVLVLVLTSSSFTAGARALCSGSINPEMVLLDDCHKSIDLVRHVKVGTLYLIYGCVDALCPLLSHEP